MSVRYDQMDGVCRAQAKHFARSDKLIATAERRCGEFISRRGRSKVADAKRRWRKSLKQLDRHLEKGVPCTTKTQTTRSHLQRESFGGVR